MKKVIFTSLMAGSLIVSGLAFADNHTEKGPKAASDKQMEKPYDGKKDRHGKFMEKLDTNADGVISKDEFMAKHEEHFSKMDADGDGSVTGDEMKAAHQAMKEKWAEKRGKKGERGEGGKFGKRGDKPCDGEGPHGNGPDHGAGDAPAEE